MNQEGWDDSQLWRRQAGPRLNDALVAQVEIRLHAALMHVADAAPKMRECARVGLVGYHRVANMHSTMSGLICDLNTSMTE